MMLSVETEQSAIATRLATALAASRDAGELIMNAFGRHLEIDIKADGSSVTAVDRAAERVLRESIRSRHQHDAILGEELGEESGMNEWRWILDPIDGTTAFIAGVPLFGVLVAAELNSRPVLGVLHFPALGETVWASSGAGAWFNGTRASVSSIATLAEARVLTTELADRPYDALSPERTLVANRLREGWLRLAAGAALARTWGDAYGYALVATGRAEVMLDPSLSIWDAAPLLVVIEEAGGVFTDAADRAVHTGGTAIASNRALRPVVDRALNGDVAW